MAFFEEEVEKDIENECVVFERWCSSAKRENVDRIHNEYH